MNTHWFGSTLHSQDSDSNPRATLASHSALDELPECSIIRDTDPPPAHPRSRTSEQPLLTRQRAERECLSPLLSQEEQLGALPWPDITGHRGLVRGPAEMVGLLLKSEVKK